MVKDSGDVGFWKKARVALKTHAFSVTFWVLLFLIVGTLLMILKYLQTGWSTPTGFSTAAWDEAFFNRIDDLSTILLFLACLTGFLLVFPVYDLESANKITDLIPLTRGAVTWFLVLVVLNWAVYFQAVYRDGGTFLWAMGDGRAAVATSWSETLQADDAQRDRLGQIFAEKKTWSTLDPAMQAVTRTRAVNAKAIAGLQAIEGMTFLFLLGIWSFLGVLVNVYISRLGTLRPKDRGQAAASACIGLVAACITPVVLLTALSAVSTFGNWKQGVESIFLATISALAVWGAFLVALVRVLRNGAAVIRWMPGSSVPEQSEP